jgi:glutathione S-transferase
MELYYVVGSPNCRKVHAVIHRLGLALEFVYLDFFSGELRAPDYRGLNPNAMVPALVDDGFVLWESNAIMQYLADGAPENSLFPRDRKVRADIVRWLCWELAHYNKALGALSFETVAKPGFMGAPPDEATVKWARGELERHAPVLEGHLRGRTYAVGETLTLADYALAHLESFQPATPFDWGRFPNIVAYYERIRADPHWAATAPPSPATIGRKPG